MWIGNISMHIKDMKINIFKGIIVYFINSFYNKIKIK